MFKSLLTACAFALCAGAASAAPIFSDDFASYGNASVLSAPDDVFNGTWTSKTPSVDYLAGRGAYGSLCGGYGNCVDLDGSSSSSGLFSTTTVFSAGTYVLDFHLLGNGRVSSTDDVTVTLGDVTINLLAIGMNDVISFSQEITTAGGALSFQNSGGDNTGAILTSASISVAAVPLPAAGFLLLGALGGLAAVRRRKPA